MSGEVFDAMALGERIRKARQLRRMSESELARRIGCTVQAVSSWELGKRSPRADAVRALSRVLDVSADWLLDTLGE